VIRSRGGIQKGKLIKQLRGMTGLNPGLGAGQEKLLDPLVPEAVYHPGKNCTA
jgi:hypothetical protein